MVMIRPMTSFPSVCRVRSPRAVAHDQRNMAVNHITQAERRLTGARWRTYQINRLRTPCFQE
jgi:hypothetical protein